MTDRADTNFWLTQIQAVKDDLARLYDRVDVLASTVNGNRDQLGLLTQDVHHYISHHDEWCAGLSRAVGGAAAVLSKFERYTADGAEGAVVIPKVAAGASFDEPQPTDGHGP